MSLESGCRTPLSTPSGAKSGR
ncbi:hypothetical protein [Acinetobacter sp. MN12]